ncbi:MAG: hypothetical protein ABI045_03875 [Flavobacteriales bacterium]
MLTLSEVIVTALRSQQAEKLARLHPQEIKVAILTKIETLSPISVLTGKASDLNIYNKYGFFENLYWYL